MKFEWEKEQEKAFSNLKSALTHANNLALPVWTLPFNIYTDASGVATGATLSQSDKGGKIRVVAYHSKTLNKDQVKWSTTKREMFGIVDACRKWRVYCNGKVHIYTDHKPLVTVKKQKDPRGCIERWLVELDPIDCEIQYIPGKKIWYLIS